MGGWWGGGGGVRSGNGPTSEMRALYGVFRPKKTQKRYAFGRSAGRGGSGPGTARPKKYVPFTAFSGPKKRYVFGRLAGGGGGGGGGGADLRNTCPLRRKTQKRYVFGRSAGVRRSRPPERVQVFLAKYFTLLFSSLVRELWAWGFRVAQGVRFFVEPCEPRTEPSGTVAQTGTAEPNRRNRNRNRTEPNRLFAGLGFRV